MNTRTLPDALGRPVRVDSMVEVLPSGDYQAHLRMQWPDGMSRVFGRRCGAHNAGTVRRMERAVERTVRKVLTGAQD